MRGKLTITVPPQEKPSPDSFNTRPAEVKKWVQQLPMADRGEATRVVFRALREVNRLDIPLKHRFEFLQAISAPANILLEALENHFNSGELPLPEKRVHIASLSTKFYSELIIGYRTILNSGSGSSSLFKMGNKDMLVISLQRMFHCFSGIISNFQQLNMLYPKGFWQEIHALYRAVDKQGWRDVKPPSLTKSRGVISLEQEYKRLLLLALIPLHNLRKEQIAEARQFVDGHLNDVELNRLNIEGLNEVFCVRYDIDVPVSVFSELCFREMDGFDAGQLFDSRKLVDKIDALLQQENGEHSPLEGGGNISRNTLDTLMRCWTPELAERALRHYSNESCKLLVGLTAINIFISRDGNEEIEEQHDEEAAQEDEMELSIEDYPDDTTQEFRPWDSTITTQEAKGDVWNKAFPGREKEQEHWASQTVIIGHDDVTGRLVNYSETGFCLMVPEKEVGSLRQGELIAVRLQGHEAWQLVALRWLQQGGMDSYLIGVEVMATHTLPVHLLIESDTGKSEPVPAMIGLNKDSRPLLLLHYFPGIEKKSLTLDYRGGQVAIELDKKQFYTQVFEGFYFHEVQRDEKAPSAVAALKYLQSKEPGFIEVRKGELAL